MCSTGKTQINLAIREPAETLVILGVEGSKGIPCLAPFRLGVDVRSFRWTPFDAKACVRIGHFEDDKLVLGRLLSFLPEFERVNRTDAESMSVDVIFYQER